MIRRDFHLPPVIESVVDGVVDVERLNAEQRCRLVRAVLGYTLRVMDCRTDMKRMLEDFVPHRAVIQIGSNVKESFDLLVPVKNLIYRLLQIQETDRKEVIRRFKQCGLTKRDADLYFWLHDLDLYEPAMIKLRKAKGEFLPPREVKARAEEALHVMCQRSWIKKNKVVSRMFRFIYKHYREITPDDVIQELLSKASFVFYLEYPFYPTLHIINKMKQSVTNNGINLLQSKTNGNANARFINAKRNKHDKNEPDHFVSMESTVYGRDSSGEERLKVEAPFDLNPADVENQNVLRISVAALLENNTGKRRRILHLLMHHNRTDFVKFVSQRYNRKFRSVEEFYTFVEGDARWLDAIRRYSKMNRKDFRRFIKTVRVELEGVP